DRCEAGDQVLVGHDVVEVEGGGQVPGWDAGSRIRDRRADRVPLEVELLERRVRGGPGRLDIAALAVRPGAGQRGAVDRVLQVAPLAVEPADVDRERGETEEENEEERDEHDRLAAFVGVRAEAGTRTRGHRVTECMNGPDRGGLPPVSKSYQSA